MAAEFGKDELLAQAILDLELKMKHEIRQNNAYLLSKIEKHYEQTDKKLTFLEAKMEAMCREREDRHHSHNRGGRRTNYFATNNFAQNNPIGRAYGVDGGRRPPGPPVVLPPSMPNQAQQQQHPYKVFGAGGSAGGGGGGGGNNAAASNRHQFKQNIEKQPVGDGHGHGGRYKQTLGTSKAQVASPSTWTTKAAGLYTDDENESDTSVESRKSDAKHLAPPTQPPQNELVVVVEEDKGQNDGNDADNNDEQKPQQQEIVEEVAAGDDVVVVTAVEGEDANGEKVVVEKLETREEMTGSSDSQPKLTVEMRKESTDNESLTAACTSAVAMMLNIKENHPSMSTVTPGATISPVIGGFGRRRK